MLSSLSLHSDAALPTPRTAESRNQSFLTGALPSLSHISFKFLIPQSLKKRERERCPKRSQIEKLKVNSNKGFNYRPCILLLRGTSTLIQFDFLPSFYFENDSMASIYFKESILSTISIYIDHMQTSLKGEILFWRFKKLPFLMLSS